MRLVIAAVGRLKDGPERELFERYRSRLEASGRALGWSPVHTVEIGESRASDMAARQNEEAERLISKAYADERRALLDPARALPWDRVPSYGSLSGDTVFIAAVDAQGNAAALINSLYGVFGSCVVAGRSGVMLQNRAAYFSLDPAHPNCVAPGKTPLHTLIASLDVVAPEIDR